MESFKLFQKGYKIHIFKNNYFLNVYVKNEKKKERGKNIIKFKPLQINFEKIFNEYLSNFEDLINEIKQKNILILLDEIYDTNKKYIKYLNFKLLKKVLNSNETKEIISKKIYVLNIEYYLTKDSNHKRIYNFPFFSYIKKDYFNIDDIIDLIKKEDLLQFYYIDEYKYYNKELGCFIDIKDDNIEIIEKIILEFHISKRNNIIHYNLNQMKKYYDEEIIKLKKRINKIIDKETEYDIIFLYALPIIKNENYEEYDSPISYREEIRKIIKLMNNCEKKLNLKFECINKKIFEDILSKNRTKILHISAHGSYQGEYSLIIEDLEKNGKKLEMNISQLENILRLNKNNISKIDLVIVSTCFSQDLAKLFRKYGAKNIIYISEKAKIIDDISVFFTKYFYKNIFEEKTINQSFNNAKQEMISNELIKEINFNSCCCNHYHKPTCLSNNYDFDIKHNKKQCNCKDKQQPNFHNKDCIYYNNFIKYLEEKSIDKNDFKIIEEEKINKICCCDLNIEHNEIEKIKIKSDLDEFGNIKFFQNNNKGKSIINSTLSYYYDEKKYKSIKGRRDIMGRIFKNITNKGKYVILFGEKNLGKIDFTKALCVYLYERKIIKSYEIFRIYYESDYKYMEYKLNGKYKNNNIYENKNVLIIKFDNENDIINYEYFILIYQKYLTDIIMHNYYFIFIFDSNEEKEEDKIKEKYLNYFKIKLKLLRKNIIKKFHLN